MAIREQKHYSATLLVLLFFIGAIACVNYLGTPAIKMLKEKTHELAVAKADRRTGEEYIGNIQAAYGKLKAVEAQLELLNIAAPATPDLAEALVQINDIVNKTQLSLETITPSQPAGGEVSIGLTVSGSYAQLKQTLIDFEKNLRPIKVDTIALATAENSESGGMTTGGTYSIKLSYVDGSASEKSSKGDAGDLSAGQADEETASNTESQTNTQATTAGGANEI